MKRDRQPRAHHTRDRSAIQPHPLTLRVRTSVADVTARCRHAHLHGPVWTIPDIKRGRLTEEASSAAAALWSPPTEP